MARNSIVKPDILYKCTIDEIRLRVISHLQEDYKLPFFYLICIVHLYRMSALAIAMTVSKFQ